MTQMNQRMKIWKLVNHSKLKSNVLTSSNGTVNTTCTLHSVRAQLALAVGVLGLGIPICETRGDSRIFGLGLGDGIGP